MLSPLGLFHTAVSIPPIGFGLFAFLRDGKIDPKNKVGKLYLGTMLITCVTALGFLPSEGFTPGQVLTLVTLALLFAGTFTIQGKWRGEGYVQTLSLSASFLLLMVAATTETLTRLPLDSPFAKEGPTDPALTPVRLGLLVAFVFGVGYQVFKLRTTNAKRT